MSVRTPLDPFLDRYTTHRVTLLALLGVVLWALVLSLFGVLRYSAVDIAGGAVLAVAVAVAVNTAFARALRATTNLESTVITALIVALIVPAGLREHSVFLAAASATAVASKFIVTVDKQHLFNPAAVALVALALLFPELAASWWVGTAVMLPAVVVCGAAVMLKTRHTGVVLTFLGAYAVIMSAAEFADTRSLASVADAWRLNVAQSALLFFAFIMMTDPITIPSGRLVRPVSVSFVALLYATPELRFLPSGFVPEQALCIGNAVSFIIRPKYRLSLPLVRKFKVGADTWVFRFGLRQKIAFAPGQFMEWTVPHERPDGRGQRRFFTIASSPTRDELSVVMRIPGRSSSYKRALVEAGEGAQVIASRLAGDFVLPRDRTRPLAFIAGGVGVAPFIGMAQYIVDTGLKRDIVLLYGTRRADEVLFQETFERAAHLGVRTVYVMAEEDAAPAGWNERLGLINAEMIREEIPDFQERTFYLSGSQPMVHAMEAALRKLRVRRSRVRTDYFDGSVDA
jgi:ferredoxin-NADP reductase/Na+-translocating ferredoxin:NAD+ oxidoreductase RnfD subunit